MRLFLIFSITAFLFWTMHQTQQHPQLKFNSIVDRFMHPLDTRLRYRIAEVDPRFKLSLEQVKQFSEQATQIWKDGTGQDLFVYDPNAQLSIHFIYDERQIESEQRRQHISQLEQNQQQWQSKKQQLDRFEQDMLRNRQFLDLKKQQLNQQIAEYQQQRQRLQHTPITGEQHAQMQQHQQVLQYQIQQLQQEIAQYNQQIDQLNQKIHELNHLDQQLNDSIQQFRQRFQPRLFHKGLFNGKQILIYEFESEDDLRLTLAHELGHALGLGHTQDPHSLMYPTMKDQQATDFHLTPADLNLLQQR